MVLHPFDAHGLERTQADVKGDLRCLHAALADAGEGFGREVQPGGRSSDRSTLAGVHGLIAFEVFWAVRAGNVGGQRDVPEPVERLKEPGDGRKTYLAFAEGAVPSNFRLQFFWLAEGKALADADLASGADQALPLIRILTHLPGQQDFDAALQKIARCRVLGTDRLSFRATSPAVEPRRKYAGVVEHEQVVGLQKAGKVAEDEVPGRSGASIQVQHPRGGAVGQRFLGDLPRKKVVLEVGYLHARPDYRKSSEVPGRFCRPSQAGRTPRQIVLPVREFGLSETERLRYHERVRPSFRRIPMAIERQYREQIVRYGRMLHERGLVAATDGNLSVRLDESRILATPACMSKGGMRASDMVIVDMEGRLLAGRRRVSSEIGMHLLIYRLRPDVHGIVHAHPPTATGFAAAGVALNQPLVCEVVIGLGSIPLAKYGTPGTPELTDALAPLVPQYDAILMS